MSSRAQQVIDIDLAFKRAVPELFQKDLTQQEIQ